MNQNVKKYEFGAVRDKNRVIQIKKKVLNPCHQCKSLAKKSFSISVFSVFRGKELIKKGLLK